jgi:hypothetical protein
VGIPAGSLVRGRTAPAAAVLLGAISLGFGVATVLLDRVTHQATGGPAADAFVTAVGVVPVTAVGTLLAARRPRNPIGWMLLFLAAMNYMPTSQYGILDYRMRHGTLPLGWVAVVLDEFWPFMLLVITLLLWLFPDGKLPAGRWHRPAIFAAFAWLLIALALASRGVLVVAGHDVRIQANGDLANPAGRPGWPSRYRPIGGPAVSSGSSSSGSTAVPLSSWRLSSSACSSPPSPWEKSPAGVASR